MPDRLINVTEDIKPQVGGDELAKKLAFALKNLFTVTSYKRTRAYNTNYTTIFCKPTKTIANSLLIDREIVALLTSYTNVQVRSVKVIQQIINNQSPRLSPNIAIVLHSDKEGDDKLRNWGREDGVTIIPIYRPRGSVLPSSDVFRQRLSKELFSSDPFQITGPVSDDIDFFGRKNEALEMLRQLNTGRIRSIFGIRKVGKTSLINRLIKLATDSGSPRIAMVDCSVKEFYNLDADHALRALAKVSKMAATRGYAHITDALKRTDDGLVPVFDDLWAKGNNYPLAIVFDEIDYITPDSTHSAHWKIQFNDFWRELRVLVQEAQRHNVPVGILVSGVSSRCFRVPQINGHENSVLHFVPEEYLKPFSRQSSISMISDLSKRCGIIFSKEGKEYFAKICGDFPYWIRMAGSHIHRAIDVENRPVEIPIDKVKEILDEFVRSEGREIAAIAIKHMENIYPELFSVLTKCIKDGDVNFSEGRLLERYGLAIKNGVSVSVVSDMIKSGFDAVSNAPESSNLIYTISNFYNNINIATSTDWSEELAVINKRRNIIERKLRDLIRFSLKIQLPKGSSWVEVVLGSIPNNRRNDMSSFSGDVIMEKLFWLDLLNIVKKNWPSFQSTFGDIKRFEVAMDLLNDRPDAHAKEIDLADVALQRRELKWLEEKVLS
ncbi:MAG: ATP-binding protein [Desulfuromonadaceae bacterium]|nr:ATP-binding protein [Desulfuromonadaceae bacterium]